MIGAGRDRSYHGNSTRIPIDSRLKRSWSAETSNFVRSRSPSAWNTGAEGHQSATPEFDPGPDRTCRSQYLRQNIVAAMKPMECLILSMLDAIADEDVSCKAKLKSEACLMKTSNLSLRVTSREGCDILLQSNDYDWFTIFSIGNHQQTLRTFRIMGI